MSLRLVPKTRELSRLVQNPFANIPGRKNLSNQFAKSHGTFSVKRKQHQSKTKSQAADSRQEFLTAGTSLIVSRSGASVQVVLSAQAYTTCSVREICAPLLILRTHTSLEWNVSKSYDVRCITSKRIVQTPVSGSGKAQIDRQAAASPLRAPLFPVQIQIGGPGTKLCIKQTRNNHSTISAFCHCPLMLLAFFASVLYFSCFLHWNRDLQSVSTARQSSPVWTRQPLLPTYVSLTLISPCFVVGSTHPRRWCYPFP